MLAQFSSIDSFIRILTRWVSWLSVVMVVLTLVIVVLRYVFQIGSVLLQETVMYMHACLFMIGCAYTLQVDQHVRVDVFYSKMSLRQRLKVNIFGHVFLLLPVCIFIAWVSFDYVINAWRIMEGSGETGGLHAVYILKSLILIFASLMILQGISQLIVQLRQLKEHP